MSYLLAFNPVDHVLNGKHGACYTTATGERRWNCEYCAADRKISNLGTLQTHLRLQHGVATTTSKKTAQLVGQEPREALWEHTKHVLNVEYGACYVSDAGEKRWKCRYCPSDLLAAHKVALKEVRQHLKSKHGMRTTLLDHAQGGEGGGGI